MSTHGQNVILCYHREARSAVAEALRVARIDRERIEYRSKATLLADGVPREDATPRYVLWGVSDAALARVEAYLRDVGAYGYEVY